MNSGNNAALSSTAALLGAVGFALLSVLSGFFLFALGVPSAPAPLRRLLPSRWRRERVPRRRRLADAAELGATLNWAQVVTTHVSSYFGIASPAEAGGSREWSRPAPIWAHAMVAYASEDFYAAHGVRARQTLAVIGGQRRSVSNELWSLALGVLNFDGDGAVDAVGACDLGVVSDTACLRWTDAARTLAATDAAMLGRYHHTAVHMSS